MKKLGFIFVILLSYYVRSNAQQIELEPLVPPQLGTWGDQGDGTYRNPVLNSNYPDSDIEKWKNKWYMISSKGRYMKGMTILESEDLVNWAIVGGIVDSVDWYDDDKSRRYGRGVWAGDLVRHNNRWYCYFIDIDKGLFVSTSKYIGGTWSKPYLMLERKGMTDPAVYFDKTEKKGYLICNYDIEDTDTGRLYHNRLYRLSWDGEKLLNFGKEVYVNTGAEAAKIYKINGKFYLFFSEWLVDKEGKKLDRRQIVLRAKNITGPFEKKILLEKDALTGRSCSQGALVEGPDNTWWYFHQLIQKKNAVEGRPQCLIPVSWKNGWPVLGKDSDGNGIGNTVWSYKKPILGKPIRSPQTDDDFNGKTLSPQWLWDDNPINTFWSLHESEGSLRLYTVNSVGEGNKYRTLPNKLLQRKMGKGKDTITLKLCYAGLNNMQSAGLIIIGFNLAVLGVRYNAFDGYRVYAETDKGERHALLDSSIESKNIYLRAILDGRTLRFSYSEGERYKKLGEKFILETRGFNGLFIGLYSMNEGRDEPGYVDFDWFSYKYDGPKTMYLDMPAFENFKSDEE